MLKNKENWILAGIAILVLVQVVGSLGLFQGKGDVPSGAVNIEDYVPVIQSRGLNTAKDVSFSGATTLSGSNTLSGATTISGASTFSADVTVDTKDFVVDVSADEVGIGTSTPSQVLHVAEAPSGDGTTASTTIELGAATTTSVGQINWRQTDGGISCVYVNAAGTGLVAQDGACTE